MTSKELAAIAAEAYERGFRQGYRQGHKDGFEDQSKDKVNDDVDEHCYVIRSSKGYDCGQSGGCKS